MTAQDSALAASIVAGIPDAVIFADASGTIRLWNGGAERIFGYRAGEAIGQTLDLIIPERLRARHWEGYHAVMGSGQTRYGSGNLLAVPATTKDGRRISIEFSIALLRDDAARVLGAAAVVRDVTARWDAERAMRAELSALRAGRSSSAREGRP